MEGLYKHIFPAVLKLGCDIEQVFNRVLFTFLLRLNFLAFTFAAHTINPRTSNRINPKGIRNFECSIHNACF